MARSSVQKFSSHPRPRSSHKSLSQISRIAYHAHKSRALITVSGNPIPSQRIDNHSPSPAEGHEYPAKLPRSRGRRLRPSQSFNTVTEQTPSIPFTPTIPTLAIQSAHHRVPPEGATIIG